MKRRLLVALFAAGLASSLCAGEWNAWPVRVDLNDVAGSARPGENPNNSAETHVHTPGSGAPGYINNAGGAREEQVLGPLYAKHEEKDGESWTAWRPILLESRIGTKEATYFLYPLFTWRKDSGYTRFSFFDLVNDSRISPEPGVRGERDFDVWPFYFSRETGQPDTTYHALFPVAGTIKNRFGKDSLTWWIFPLYFHTEINGKRITSAPWPFLRFIDGAGHHGFEFWPIAGSRGREGDYREQFYLWPFGYKSETNLSAPVPDERLGVLPFYARESGPGYLAESYLWPFFGYTHRTEPKRYDEQRYFWPLFVQGRGDERYINRWGPFYTHSRIKGYDKTWAPWPLFRRGIWDEDRLTQEKVQILYFLYWSLDQRRRGHPEDAPAYKRHLWPLFSAWDDGAGRKQFQLFSPFEVFFPNNEVVRRLYTPLFAVYRSDQRGSDEYSRSLLWHLVSWKKSPAGREFHLAMFGWGRATGDDHTRFFLFDFNRKKDMTASSAASP
ncbi:MAG TPA: hypothetical protein VHD32_14195 [Candidatus Didemnitutus sp.]|nr:hypothetical protein [Candidatus Didemnitutus sp.]